MKIHILALFFTILFLSANAENTNDDDDDNDDDITTLTFLVQYEPEPDNDHIDIGLTVEVRDSSLKSAIQKITDVVDQIQDISEAFCRENPEEGVNCEEIVDVEDFEITAEYSNRRKELLFQDFVVTHDITIRVDNAQKIGDLADKLLKTSAKIDSFDWQSDEEDDDQQEAIEAGKQKAQQMCYHLGMKLHRIVSIEEEEDDEEDAAGDDQQDGQDEDDEDDGPLAYRFEVECILDAETAARKAAEEQEQDKQEAEEQEKQKKREEEQERQRQAKKKQQQKQKKQEKPAATAEKKKKK